MTMAGEEEGTREVRFEHCEHVSYFWDPFRCAPPRTLFSSISQSRRLTMVEPLGFSFLGNMTRYWLDALCKFNLKRFHHWYVSWRNITKDHIFLTTRIFFQDTLDIKLPQGYALVFQQKGMLHAGLGNLKHMSDIKHMSYIKFTLELGSFKHMSDIKYRCDIKHMSDIKFTLDLLVSNIWLISNGCLRNNFTNRCGWTSWCLQIYCPGYFQQQSFYFSLQISSAMIGIPDFLTCWANF